MRARNIKPGFFKNDALAELSCEARLLFIGLWCMADRSGRMHDRPKRIKAEVLPYDSSNVEKLLEDLHTARFIVRYGDGDGGERYISIPNFSKHQSPHKNEKESEIPEPTECHEISRKAPELSDTNRPDCGLMNDDCGLMNDEPPLPHQVAEPVVDLQTIHEAKEKFTYVDVLDESIAFLTYQKNSKSRIEHDRLQELFVEWCAKKQKKAEENKIEPFETFWGSYPRKVGKGAAEKAWAKISRPKETLKDILTALEWQRRSDAWTKDNGTFIPHPSSYLNQRRWEDEPEERIGNGRNNQGGTGKTGGKTQGFGHVSTDPGHWGKNEGIPDY